MDPAELDILQAEGLIREQQAFDIEATMQYNAITGMAFCPWNIMKKHPKIWTTSYTTTNPWCNNKLNNHRNNNRSTTTTTTCYNNNNIQGINSKLSSNRSYNDKEL